MYRILLSGILVVCGALAYGLNPPPPPPDVHVYSGICLPGGSVDPVAFQNLASQVSANLLVGFQLDRIHVNGITCDYSFVHLRVVDTSQLITRAELISRALERVKKLDPNNDMIDYVTVPCDSPGSLSTSQSFVALIAAGYRYVDTESIANNCTYVFALEPF